MYILIAIAAALAWVAFGVMAEITSCRELLEKHLDVAPKDSEQSEPERTRQPDNAPGPVS